MPHGGWHARLTLRYGAEDGRTVGHASHEGPLRVLKALYPEGPGVCHHLVVHPPGGVVAGDVLDIDIAVGAGAHALLTTPGATRFYRSDGAPSAQHVRLGVAAGGRAEWLPAESIAHPGCRATSRLGLHLQPGAEAVVWDVLALGLPAAGQPFGHGTFVQHLELPGAWLERGCIDGADALLLDSPLGLAGRRVLGTLAFAAGSPLPPVRRDALLDAARAQLGAAPDGAGAVLAGATSPDPRVVVLRALGHGVEPVMRLLRQVRGAWRVASWELAAEPLRIWST